jgi:hypothetical protein
MYTNKIKFIIFIIYVYIKAMDLEEETVPMRRAAVIAKQMGGRRKTRRKAARRKATRRKSRRKTGLPTRRKSRRKTGLPTRRKTRRKPGAWTGRFVKVNSLGKRINNYIQSGGKFGGARNKRWDAPAPAPAGGTIHPAEDPAPAGGTIHPVEEDDSGTPTGIENFLKELQNDEEFLFLYSIGRLRDSRDEMFLDRPGVADEDVQHVRDILKRTLMKLYRTTGTGDALLGELREQDDKKISRPVLSYPEAPLRERDGKARMEDMVDSSIDAAINSIRENNIHIVWEQLSECSIRIIGPTSALEPEWTAEELAQWEESVKDIPAEEYGQSVRDEEWLGWDRRERAAQAWTAEGWTEWEKEKATCKTYYDKIIDLIHAYIGPPKYEAYVASASHPPPQG